MFPVKSIYLKLIPKKTIYIKHLLSSLLIITQTVVLDGTMRRIASSEPGASMRCAVVVSRQWERCGSVIGQEDAGDPTSASARALTSRRRCSAAVLLPRCVALESMCVCMCCWMFFLLHFFRSCTCFFFLFLFLFIFLFLFVHEGWFYVIAIGILTLLQLDQNFNNDQFAKSIYQYFYFNLLETFKLRNCRPFFNFISFCFIALRIFVLHFC